MRNRNEEDEGEGLDVDGLEKKPYGHAKYIFSAKKNIYTIECQILEDTLLI